MLVRLLHALDDLLARHAAGEFVGFRQQRTLARDFLDLAGERVVLQKPGDDLLGGEPFGDRHGVLHHLVFDDGVDHVGEAGALTELVFAGLEFAARLEHQHAADEHPGLIDHAFARQQVGNIADAEPARNIDHLVVAERSGRFEALLADVERATDGDRDHDQYCEDRIAGDHQRMPSPSGAARGGRHAFRLERGARTARGLAAGRWRDWHGARSARGSATLPAMRWIGTQAPAPAIATCKLTFDTLQFGDRSRAQSRWSGARLSPAAADSEIISSFRTLGRIMAKAWKRHGW